MTLKKYLILFVSVISLSILSANGGVFGWKGTHGTIFHLNFGSQSADINSLNDELSLFYEISYPSDFLGMGAQYLYITDDLILGVEGKHLTNGSHTALLMPDADFYNLKIDGIAGFFDIGYVLYTNRFTFIAPWVGIGMGSVNFSMIPDNYEQDSANNDIQDNFFDALSVNRTATMLNWGICMDFIFRTWSIGGSLGYMHTISDADWQLAGESIEYGTDTSLSGVYFNLNIGYSQLDLWSNIVN